MSHGEKSSFSEFDKFTKFDFSETFWSWWQAGRRTTKFPKSSAFRRAHWLCYRQNVAKKRKKKTFFQHFDESSFLIATQPVQDEMIRPSWKVAVKFFRAHEHLVESRHFADIPVLEIPVKFLRSFKCACRPATNCDERMFLIANFILLRQNRYFGTNFKFFYNNIYIRNFWKFAKIEIKGLRFQVNPNLRLTEKK